MQGGVRDDNAADGNGLQSGDRRQRTSAADLNVDGQQPGPRQFGGKFMRDRPARRGRAKAKPGLQSQIVDLVDDTVDVIAQSGALHLDGAVLGQQVGGGSADRGQLIDREIHRGKPVDGGFLAGGELLGQFAPGIGEKAQRAGGGDRGVQLAQRSGSGIARIGKGLVAGFCLPDVQGGEIGMAHINLAAHLQHLRGVDDLPGDVGNGQGVGCNILARLAIAAGGGLHQPAAFIAQRQGKPVDLGFSGEGNRPLNAQEFADAVLEIQHVLIGKCVFQAKHPDPVRHLAKARTQGPADLIGRAVSVFQCRKPRFDRGVAAFQRVIIGIRNAGRVKRVVVEIGGSNFKGQSRKLVPRLIRRQVPCRARGDRRCGHGIPPFSARVRGDAAQVQCQAEAASLGSLL